jgi:hypothetical protein
MTSGNHIVDQHETEQNRKDKPLCHCGGNDVEEVVICSGTGEVCNGWKCEVIWDLLPCWQWIKARMMKKEQIPECDLAVIKHICVRCEYMVDLD